MVWVGILACACGIFCVIWVIYAVVRIKHVRIKRVLVTLEWLALTPTVPQQLAQISILAESFHFARRTWSEAQSAFRYPLGKYLHLVWNASPKDLYWANRFGAELLRMAQSLIPLEPFPSEYPEHRVRYELIAQHIKDFALLAGRILVPSHFGRE